MYSSNSQYQYSIIVTILCHCFDIRTSYLLVQCSLVETAVPLLAVLEKCVFSIAMQVVS